MPPELQVYFKVSVASPFKLRRSTGDPLFNGSLADVRAYKRTLSKQEITA